SAPGGRARIGWVRRTSGFGVCPPALDFVLDHPPYGNAPQGDAAAQRYSYAVLASELARRFGGDEWVMPSVLWATGSETRLADSDWIVSDISPLKIAYAIDVARRFILNRAARGIPLWMLWASFD